MGVIRFGGGSNEDCGAINRGAQERIPVIARCNTKGGIRARLAIHPLNQGFDGPSYHTILGSSAVSGVANKGVSGESDPLLPRGEVKSTDSCINLPRVSVPDRVCVTLEGLEDCDPRIS